MKGFSGPRSTTVAITHGDETVELRLSALPAGRTRAIKAAFPALPRFVDGKPDPDATKGEYPDLLSAILIAEALEPGTLETRPSKLETAADYERYGRAVWAEFVAAHLTNGDLNRLLQTVQTLTWEMEDVQAEGKS